jgi:hypothetical protein
MRSLLLALLGAAAGLLGASAPALADALGVYVGGGNVRGAARFGSWLGRGPTVVMDYVPTATWSQIESPAWSADRWRRTSYRTVYSVAMLPSTGTATLREGAAGAYDEHFRALARALVRHGQRDAIIRLGWEFNEGWYRWSIVGGKGADYAEYWRRIVRTMRAVSPRFRFDWCTNNGSAWGGDAPIDPASAYPGDAYVDYIGQDVYDQSWAPDFADAAIRWKDLVDKPYGLAWLARFAREHGKPMSLPEWGLVDRADGHGGSDSPEYIDRMHAWIASHDVGYSVYFDDDAPDGRHRLGHFPRAAERFRGLFGWPAPLGALTTVAAVRLVGGPAYASG